jgi:putative ABC transport system substrate-binding protein
MNVLASPAILKAMLGERCRALLGLCCVAQALAGAFAQTVPSAPVSPLPPSASVVVAVSGGTGEAYEQAAQALERSLTQVLRLDGKTAVFVHVDARDGTTPIRTEQARLYIALGVQACTQLARQNAPALNQALVLCTLLPRQSFEYLMREAGRQAGPDFSALYLNQPLSRQLDLIRLALPRARRVGVLLGTTPDARRTEAQLVELARERGLRVVSARVDAGDPLFPGLKQVLDEADVLLAMADPQIYNSHTIQNILLTSFRAKVPMQAFSPAYARAGALLALYATPEQIGAQVALLVRDALTEQDGSARGFGPPQHTQLFEVNVNAHVARSLGLQLDAAALADRLRRLEARPGPERKSERCPDARDALARACARSENP